MFQPATKRRAKLRLALAGPSGSGKTWSALRVATGIGGKIAVIDTERGSASLYSDAFAFDVCEVEPPYTPAKYVAAIRGAEAAGYAVLVIDSLSHAWAGEGGVLESVDARQQAGGNKLVAWGQGTKDQNALVNAILGSGCDVIATMRSKQEYAIEPGHNGKTTVRKLGMAPVQRDGLEYEFAIVLDIGMDHLARVGVAGKDRTRLFAGQDAAMLTEADGQRLRAWLDTGADPVAATGPTVEDVRDAIRAAMHAGGWDAAAVSAALAKWGAAKASDLPTPEARAEALALFRSPPQEIQP